MPKPDNGEERSGGVCYQNGEVVKENYQMCDVTNKKIVDILEGKRPQVTFTCNAEKETCDFQCKYCPKTTFANANISKSGLNIGNPSTARSTPVPLRPTMITGKTVPATNATTYNANAFRIECCAARMDRWI
jgi:hypothetical protein